MSKMCLKSADMAYSAQYDGRPRYDLFYESVDMDPADLQFLMDNPVVTIKRKESEKKVIRIDNTTRTNKMPRFGGAYPDGRGGLIYIKEVIYEKPATIILWSDGTKTTSKCDPKDTYSPETGVALAILKKVMGGEFVAKTLSDWMPEEGQKRVTLKDVRKKNND